MSDWLGALRARSQTLSAKGTLILLAIVSVAVFSMSALGYRELRHETATHIAVRLDRAARAGAMTIAKTAAGIFTVRRSSDGRPLSYQLAAGTAAEVLKPTVFFDTLVQEVANINQGFVNLFRFDVASGEFHRIATSTRMPDGRYVRHAVVGKTHPAYESIMATTPFVGEVPVMGRNRIAYLTPVLDEQSRVAGFLAVDVGWQDDLWRASNELFSRLLLWSLIILGGVAALGSLLMLRAMLPFRTIARYARAIADRQDAGPLPFTDRNDEIGHVARGIADVVAMRAKLEALAFSDELTGLPSRAWLEQELEQRLARVGEIEQPSYLMLLGINNFRLVNDAFGHRAGDEALRFVGGLLGASLGPGARLVRFGADEFAVLLGEGRSKRAALRQASELLATLHHPILLKYGSVHLSACIGVVRLPDDCATVEEALKNVTLAMHKAKSVGKNQILLYSNELDYTVQRRITLERDLRSAIAAGDMILHYQPQVCVDTNRLHGVEALVRWPHRHDGMISPVEFIPIAEEAGIIVELGTWVLEEACRQAREWQDAGFEFGKVSVNISPIQLWQPNFERLVAAILERNGLAPHRLCLEVTESVFINRETEVVQGVLRRLSEQGIVLSLDDFGTGYSSLGYLRSLPFAQLKIDRSFVQGADGDSRRQSLLGAVVALGRGLGMQVIAEGVETASEAATIRALSCDAIQGYYYARPQPALKIPLEAERIRQMRDDQPSLATVREIRSA